MPSATALYNTGKMLNAADLATNPAIGLNKRVPAIIHRVEPEQVGQDQKVMLMGELVSKNGQAWPKKLPFNKTNTLTMVAAFGDDYSLWAGKAIEVWAENVMFSGKIVPGLKVQAAPNGAAPAQAQAIPMPAPTQAAAPPPPSATAVAGVAPVAGVQFAPVPGRNPTSIDEDEIPF